MQNLLESKWRVSGGYEILHYRFGDQYAVYHCGSGDTHLVDDVGYWVLAQLNQGERLFQQLLSALVAEFDLEAANQPGEFLRAALNEFQNQALIERLES